MAEYGPPGGAGGLPPSFPPPPFGMPPGFHPPPGMPPLATGIPPAMSPPFPIPPNMPPGVDFSAPVIRLGVDGPPRTEDMRGGRGGRRDGRNSNMEPLGGRNRLGLGARDGGRDDLADKRAAIRESMSAQHPPTREEVARTIFIGGLGEGAPDDEHLESILRCAGKLRRWIRVKDADEKKCKFGFAEYEDSESLEAANEIFGEGIDVPVFENGVVKKNDDGEVAMMHILVVVDEQSKAYIAEWKAKRHEDDDARQFRIDGCREDVRQCIASLSNLGAYGANADTTNGRPDTDGDTFMQNGDAFASNADVVTIPVTLEDELSDIPAEMRSTVAAEIRAFRDRSNRRDVERLKREEEMDYGDRSRSGPGSRLGSGVSPSAGAANGVPLGPRGVQGVQGAPAGPKGFRGAQLPSDYANGVSFVGANGATKREDEPEESDEELERRRQKKKLDDLDRQYASAERRWLTRERTRTAAAERESEREGEMKREREAAKQALATRLKEWNDDEEMRKGRELYYRDKGSWLRKRGVQRDREEREDDRDRREEQFEQANERRRQSEARGMADAFLDQLGHDRAQQSAGLKISLGAAGNKARAPPATAVPAKRPMADIEGLLEDEEDAAAAAGTSKKALPLKPLSSINLSDLTDEERTQLRSDLAREIPTDPEALFTMPLKHLSPGVLDKQIRPFVEKKVIEFLGVQEDMLVEMVVGGIQDGKGAKEIVDVLEEAMGEEAENLVLKVWRLAVFWSEAGVRGLD